MDDVERVRLLAQARRAAKKNRKPYVPEELPIKDIDYARLAPLIKEAKKSLAAYNSILTDAGSMRFCALGMSMRLEAVYSSKN